MSGFTKGKQVVVGVKFVNGYPEACDHKGGVYARADECFSLPHYINTWSPKTVRVTPGRSVAYYGGHYCSICGSDIPLRDLVQVSTEEAQ